MRRIQKSFRHSTQLMGKERARGRRADGIASFGDTTHSGTMAALTAHTILVLSAKRHHQNGTFSLQFGTFFRSVWLQWG
jgi:hypothetical protein